MENDPAAPDVRENLLEILWDSVGTVKKVGVPL